MWGKGLIAFGFGLAASLPALADAVVVPDQGIAPKTVLFSRGRGFEPISSPVQGHAGDSVMALARGQATVVYADGCRVPVSANTAVVFIYDTSPCKAAAIDAPRSYPVGRYIVGAALIGGVAVGIVALSGGGGDNHQSKRKKDKPASP